MFSIRRRSDQVLLNARGNEFAGLGEDQRPPDAPAASGDRAIQVDPMPLVELDRAVEP